MGKTATIRDVAQRASVSTATVSRVLNDDAHVVEATRQRVMDAIADLRYSRNDVARSLKTRSSRIVGIVSPELTNDFFMGIANGIEAALKKLKYSVIICSSNESRDEEKRLLKVLVEKAVDGVIVIPASDKGSHLKPFQDAGMPIVLADRLVEDFEADAALSDNFGGAREVVAAFIRRGARRIAFIGGASRLSNARERFEGYRAALAEGGIEEEPGIERFGDFHMESGRALMKDLLGRENPPRAFFIANLYMHIGATSFLLSLPEAERRGIRIAGFDSMAYSPLLGFCTLAVEQRIAELGGEAARLIMDRIGKRDKPFPEIVRLPTRLVVTENER
jgi:LacI family transcriptional regulator